MSILLNVHDEIIKTFTCYLYTSYFRLPVLSLTRPSNLGISQYCSPQYRVTDCD